MGRQKSFFFSADELFNGGCHGSKVGARGKRRSKLSTYEGFGCITCGLDKACRSPRIRRYGEGRKRILVVGMCPGRDEDIAGIPFVGRSGKYLRGALDLVGIDLDKDCIRTNVVACYPGKDSYGRDKKPTDRQIKSCVANLHRDIRETSPDLILCLGNEAINAVLHHRILGEFGVGKVHGKVFPCHEWGCWVGCSYHPSFFLHKESKPNQPSHNSVFIQDLVNIFSYLDEPLPSPLTDKGNKCLLDVDEVVESIRRFSSSEKPVSFDYETTELSPYNESSQVVSIAVCNDVGNAVFIPLAMKREGGFIFSEDERKTIFSAWKDFLKSDAPKVVQNYYMEGIWSIRVFGQEMKNFIWDTQVGAHILSNRVGTSSLDFQAFEMTGHIYGDMVNKTEMASEPIDLVCTYNCWDARYTLMAYYRQISLMDDSRKKFAALSMRSLISLARASNRGILIDTSVFDEFRGEYLEELKKCEKNVLSLPVIRRFEEENRSKFNLSSSVQLQKVIYEICREPKVEVTSTGKGSTSEGVLKRMLEETKNEDVKVLIGNLLRRRKLTGFLKRIESYEELIDSESRVHPTFNLHIADTYRSTSTDPNIQNVYKRDKELIKFRRAIVPSPGNVFLEADYSGIEVRCIAMESGDPELIRQIKDGVDTHLRWASLILDKPESEVDPKEERYRGKNQWVFPCFYGQTPKNLSKAWPDVPVRRIERLFDRFWQEFSGVRRWQERMIKFYNENGYVIGRTGFWRIGPLSVFQLYNNTIQGIAYHLLQDAFNRIDDYLVENGFRSRLVAEIHDAVLVDAHIDEVEKIVEICTEIMCSKRFDWQRDVPLSVSWEIGINWYEMEKLDI
ncbi:MAG: DNA polymerase [Candidatus Freyarchaeota archaeon]